MLHYVEWSAPLSGGYLEHRVDCSISELPLRLIDYAAESYRIVRILQNAQVCDEILYLHALVEADAAEYAVGNSAL